MNGKEEVISEWKAECRKAFSTLRREVRLEHLLYRCWNEGNVSPELKSDIEHELDEMMRPEDCES